MEYPARESDDGKIDRLDGQCWPLSGNQQCKSNGHLCVQILQCLFDNHHFSTEELKKSEKEEACQQQADEIYLPGDSCPFVVIV